jgi:two-component system, chemotaxis family, chemotaxis protein CheY
VLVSTAADKPVTPATILVTDDDADIRGAVAELLEDEGYQVVQASDGQAAQAYLSDHPSPACILLDLWMPGMDGWTFAAKLKEGKSSNIPVIVITAAEPHWGYPAPSLYVLRKPLDPNRLTALVHALADPLDAPSAGQS